MAGVDNIASTAKMNQGIAPPPEQPSSFNEGQTGKGVEIGGKVTAMEGSDMPVGNDPHAGKLRQTWNKAKNANGKFGNF